VAFAATLAAEAEVEPQARSESVLFGMAELGSRQLPSDRSAGREPAAALNCAAAAASSRQRAAAAAAAVAPPAPVVVYYGGRRRG